MLTQSNVKTISDMRLDAVNLLNQASTSSGPTYLMYHSKPKAVLLGLEQYQKLLDAYQDQLDSQEAQEWEKEDKSKVKWLTIEEAFDE
ncbi:MAG: type II toxin-antitoxin system Phd/YefM family antitoxin [Patescibacteria group bacterium]